MAIKAFHRTARKKYAARPSLPSYGGLFTKMRAPPKYSRLIKSSAKSRYHRVKSISTTTMRTKLAKFFYHFRFSLKGFAVKCSGCPVWNRTRTKRIKISCAASTPRDNMFQRTRPNSHQSEGKIRFYVHHLPTRRDRR